VPTQDLISRDNVSIHVNAVIYFRMIDPERAIIQVEQFDYAISQLAQTTLRSVLGKHELDEMLSERDKLNKDIQEILDARGIGIRQAGIGVRRFPETAQQIADERKPGVVFVVGPHHRHGAATLCVRASISLRAAL